MPRYNARQRSSGLIATVTGPAHVGTNTWEANRDVLDTKVNTKIDTTLVSGIDYTVNALGQRTDAARSGTAANSTTWGYDALGQVASSDDSNNAYDRFFEYDTIGNRKQSRTGSATGTGGALTEYFGNAVGTPPRPVPIRSTNTPGLRSRASLRIPRTTRMETPRPIRCRQVTRKRWHGTRKTGWSM